MGLDCTLWQISPEKLRCLIDSEEAVEEFIDFVFPEDYVEEVFQDISKTSQFYEKDLGLEKMWHLLHYLLTGDENSDDYPLAFAIVVGHSINEIWEDLTYVEPHEVKEIATAISNISETKIRARIAGLASEDIDIYGGIDYSDDDDIVETLSYISKLKEFYIEAAIDGNAILHFVS
jgi:hypothetical protein